MTILGYTQQLNAVNEQIKKLEQQRDELKDNFIKQNSPYQVSNMVYTTGDSFISSVRVIKEVIFFNIMDAHFLYRMEDGSTFPLCQILGKVEQEKVEEYLSILEDKSRGSVSVFMSEDTFYKKSAETKHTHNYYTSGRAFIQAQKLF